MEYDRVFGSFSLDFSGLQAYKYKHLQQNEETVARAIIFAI